MGGRGRRKEVGREEEEALEWYLEAFKFKHKHTHTHTVLFSNVYPELSGVNATVSWRFCS